MEGICATNLAWTLLRASRWEEAADAADRGLVRLTSVGITEAVTAQILADPVLWPGAATTATQPCRASSSGCITPRIRSSSRSCLPSLSTKGHATAEARHP
jgi:hypothetical protein